MNDDILQSVIAIGELAYRAVEHSALFSLVVFLLKVYSAVLLIDFVLIIFNRDLASDIKKTRYGTVRPLISYAGANKKWKGIIGKLDTGNASYYKAAILEADSFIDRLLSQMGYEGRNFQERLDAIPEGQVVSVPVLREAHEVRNRIIREADFEISQEEANETLGKYRKFLDELNLL
jgi:hypothetical protein